MRLLLTIGYWHLLFGKDANTTGILTALEGARLVESKGYGNDKKYIVSDKPDDGEFQFVLIQDNAITLPEINNRQLDLIVKIEEEKSKATSAQYSALYDLENAKKKIVELEATIEKLTPKEESK